MTSPTTEQNLYRYESDQAIFVNLETPDTELLRERQKALQESIAKLTRDLMVVTDAITGGNNGVLLGTENV